jgi:DedD protein
MPPELPNDQELSLKKRARRRLVGAIALVLLMVIVLPMILQDRSALAPQAPIKITMPDVPSPTVAANVVSQSEVLPSDSAQVPEIPAVVEDAVTPNVMLDKPSDVAKESTVKNDESKKVLAKTEAKAEVKESVTKSPEVALDEQKLEQTKVQSKNSDSFSIQIGVYSDAANVKQLQNKLKALGYVSYTEKMTTDKGEKIRLRAGHYNSRQAASDALVKLQKDGLSGIVISHE